MINDSRLPRIPGTQSRYEGEQLKKAIVILPVSVGLLFFAFSLPVILGLSAPSIHEDAYGGIYVIINMPAIVIFGSLSEIVAEWLTSGDPFVEFDNLVMIAFCHLFWIALAFVAGFLVDRYRRRHVAPADKRGGS